MKGEDGQMTANEAENHMESALVAVVGRINPVFSGVEGLKRLSGGASQESWVFTAVGDESQVLVLRRTPGGKPKETGGTAVPLATEAAVIMRAKSAGVSAPSVAYVLRPEDGLGEGYFMAFVEGATIARKILRDEAYAEARPLLARQCGEALAKIHKVSCGDIEGLPTLNLADQIQIYFDLYASFDEPHPVFELAFRWLKDNQPAEQTPRLVHGDFRNGNLMVGPEGLRAVLDWELTHLGDPTEDLGWICVNSWRFGQSENRVGGFGSLEDLTAGYEAAGGGTVDLARVHYWEVFGTLKWGIMCMLMVSAFRTGLDTSVERAAIGRRASETEIDLLNLLAGGT